MKKNSTHLANSKLFVDPDNARFEDQRQLMEQIIEDGLCPFCPEFLEKYHHKPILQRGKYWTLTENQWPYDNAKVHLLAIFNIHIEHLCELPSDAGKELIEMFCWAEDHYNAPGGGFAMRFGDTNYSAGTVAHLHAQFIIPDWQKEDFEPVRVKIGKTKRKVEALQPTGSQVS